MNERLVNWGNWSRGGASKSNSCSPLYRLMKEHDPGFSPQDPRIQPDEKDALLLDKIILAVCSSLEREILAERYIKQLTDMWICRRNHIRFRDFSWMMRKILQKLDIAVRDPKIISN